MFFSRKAQLHELDLVKKMLINTSLPIADLEKHLQTFMVGELEGEVVSIGGLEIYDHTAIMRGVVVLPEFQGQYLGETTARGLIHLADVRKVKFIYTLIKDLNMGYLLAKMRFVPCERNELIQACPDSLIPEAKPDAQAWKLDLEQFFSASCSGCSIEHNN